MARIVVALGGNALLKRGEAMTAANQRENARIAAEALAPLCAEHEVVITHGNGPQVGLLALQEIAYPARTAARRARGRDRGRDRLHDRAGARQPAAVREADRHAPHHGRGRPRRPGLPGPDQVHRQGLRRGRGRRPRRPKGLDGEARRQQLAPGRALAAAEADLPAPPDQVAAREGRRGDRRRRRRHPDDVREGQRHGWSASNA